MSAFVTISLSDLARQFPEPKRKPEPKQPRPTYPAPLPATRFSASTLERLAKVRPGTILVAGAEVSYVQYLRCDFSVEAPLLLDQIRGGAA